MELDPVKKYFLEGSVQSMYALWSALLTINGVMLSGFALLRLAAPNKASTSWVSVVVVCCAVSLILLTHNFVTTKRHYRDNLARTAENRELTPAEKILAEKRAGRVDCCELAVLALLVVEVLLVVILLFKVNAPT